MNRKIILHLICVIASVTGLAVLLSGGVSFMMKDKLTDSVALSLTGLVVIVMEQLSLTVICALDGSTGSTAPTVPSSATMDAMVC